MNRLITKLGSSRQEEINFFILSTNCLNLVEQSCPRIHFWKTLVEDFNDFFI